MSIISDAGLREQKDSIRDIFALVVAVTSVAGAVTVRIPARRTTLRTGPRRVRTAVLAMRNAQVRVVRCILDAFNRLDGV